MLLFPFTVLTQQGCSICGMGAILFTALKIYRRTVVSVKEVFTHIGIISHLWHYPEREAIICRGMRLRDNHAEGPVPEYRL